MRVTGGETDEALAKLTIARSSELLGWLNVQGVRFQPPLGGTLSLGKTNAFFLGGGRGALNALYRRAEALGVSCLYDDAGHRARPSRTAISCRRRSARRPARSSVRGRALVAACGGFEANVDWLKQYWGAAADNFLIRGTPYNRGEVLRMLLDAGVASVGDPTQCHAVAIDARAPKFDGGIVTRLDSVVFGIVVNRDAQRFYDEGEDFWPKRYAIWGRLIAQQPGQIAYSIIDASSLRLFMPSIFPAIEARIDRRAGAEARARSGGAREAPLRNSMPRCSRAHSTTPCSTTARTEGLAIREEPLGARASTTPPFYAYPLRPGITFTYLGVRVNEQARMLLEDGRPSRQHVCRRRDHGRQRAGQGLSRRHRHDHRRGVRPDRGRGGGTHVTN